MYGLIGFRLFVIEINGFIFSERQVSQVSAAKKPVLTGTLSKPAGTGIFLRPHRRIKTRNQNRFQGTSQAKQQQKQF
jgi:hypothetical protein